MEKKFENKGSYLGGFTHANQHPSHREAPKRRDKAKQAPTAPTAKMPENKSDDGGCEGCGGGN